MALLRNSDDADFLAESFAAAKTNYARRPPSIGTLVFFVSQNAADGATGILITGIEVRSTAIK